METLIMAIVPSLVVGVIMHCYNKKADARYQREKDHAEARLKNEKLSMELQMATARLSYATAVALKCGHPNGEVEDGIKAYEKAKKNYYDFINNEYVEHIQE